MTLVVNSGSELLIDEDATSTSADETAAVGAAWYSSSVQATIQALDASAVDAGANKQVAVDFGMFTIAASCTDLAFASNAAGTAGFSATAGVDSGLQTANGQAIYLYSVAGGNDNVVVGRIGLGGTGDIVFSIALDEQVTSGIVTAAKVWFTQYAALRHSGVDVVDGDIVRLTNKLFVKSTETGTTTVSDFATAASGQNDFVVYTSPTSTSGTQLLATSIKNGSASTVNTSTTGLGVQNQAVDPGEVVRLDSVKGATKAAGSTSELSATDHVDGTGMGWTITQVGGGQGQVQITLALYNVAQGSISGSNLTSASAAPVPTALSYLTVTNGTTVLVQNGVVLAAGTAQGITVALGGGSLVLGNLKLHDHIAVTTDVAHAFDRMTVSNTGTQDFDIGSFTFTSVPTTTTSTAEVGGHIAVDDSGPTISAQGSVASMTVDESFLGLPGATATQSLSSAFTHGGGFDGEASVAYSLQVDTSVSTGLASGGQAVQLRLNGGVVEGYTSAGTVFTVAVDSGAQVTLVQLMAIDHANASNPDDLSSAMPAGAIKLVGTVADKDGDHASAVLSLGDKLQFRDDGPSITTGGSVTVTATTDGSGTPGTGTATFTSASGSDGPATSGATTYALSITDAGTGLSSGGSAITLSMSGDAVVGKTAGGATVFTVTVSASGGVTVTQSAPIDHAAGSDTATLIGNVAVVGTVKDDDGDTKSASDALTLTFNDAGPAVSAVADLLGLSGSDASLNTPASEGSAFVIDNGPDVSGTVDYRLDASSTATGLKSGGADITLSGAGTGTITGIAGATIVFTLWVASDGTVTLTQSAPIDHASDSDSVTLADLISVAAQATDFDGDSSDWVSRAISLTFGDDKPTVTPASEALGFSTSDASLNTASTRASGFTTSFGADGAAAIGAMTYSLKIEAAASGLSSQGVAVVLSANLDGSVSGYAGTTEVIRLKVNATGDVTVTQLAAVDHPVGSDSTSMNGKVSVQAKAKDSDGDESALASRAINVAIADAAPRVRASGAALNLALYDASLNTANDSFAGLFTIDPGADGLAAVDAITYALGVSANGADSLLRDAITKEHILLKLDGSKVVGYTQTGLQTVFEVTVDALGSVSAKLLRAIDHTGIADNSVAAVLGSAGLVTLTATATDSDGDTDSASVGIGQMLAFHDATPEFVETTVAGGPQAVDNLRIKYKTGEQAGDTFAVDFHHDTPTPVNVSLGIGAQSSEGLLTRSVGANKVEFVKSLDPLTQALYTLEVTNTSYTVTVNNAPTGLPQQVAFDKLPSGSPVETVTAPLTGGYGGSVTVDGLVFDPRKAITWNSSTFKSDYTAALNPKLNGALSDADDINTNNIGFGVKGGQASQINPNEGFKVQYNAPNPNTNGGLDHLTHLSFDVYGIGNIPNVEVNYWLYRADGTLVDAGTRSTSQHMDLNGVIDRQGLLLTDNKAHNIDLFDDGATTGAIGLAGSGDYFDYAVVNFTFPLDKKGIIDNQGIRIGTFFTQIAQTPETDTFHFNLSATDADGDTVTVTGVQVTLDPALLAASLY